MHHTAKHDQKVGAGGGKLKANGTKLEVRHNKGTNYTTPSVSGRTAKTAEKVTSVNQLCEA